MKGEYPWRVWGLTARGGWAFLSAHTERWRARRKALMVTSTAAYLSHPTLEARIEFGGMDDPRSSAERAADASIKRKVDG